MTELKLKKIISFIQFWITTIPESLSAQKADGVLLCEFTSRNRYQHRFTVWKTKIQMLAYQSSPSHLKAMKRISQISSGKVYGYETEAIPSREGALEKWDKNERKF